MALQQVHSSELKRTLHKAQDFRGWPKDVSAQGSVQRVEAHAPQGAELKTLVLARSEGSRRSGQFRNCYPKNMKQEPRRTRKANPQSGLGGGCKRCSRSRKLRGLSLHAQARRTSISLSLTIPCVLPKEGRQTTWRWRRKDDAPKVPQGQGPLATRRRKGKRKGL